MTPLPPPLTPQEGWLAESQPQPVPAGAAPDDLPPLGLVTPSYNQGEYLEATIRSVLLQGYPKLEYYIEDGGSTDNSRRIIEHYAAHLSGWVSERDNGQSHAINKGLARLHRAEWINWLNSDDHLEPGALWRVARAAMERLEARLLVGASRRQWPGTRREAILRRQEVTLESVLRWNEGNWLPQPATWFRRQDFSAIGGLREDLHFVMDFHLWVQLLRLGGPVAEIPGEPLVTTLHHEDAKTVAQRGRTQGELAAVLMELGFRDAAIRHVEMLAKEADEARRFFRMLERLPGVGAAMGFYNRRLRPGRDKSL